MGIEAPIDDISSLNEAWPLDNETQKFTDDHLRLTKDAIRKQFTDLAANGGVVTVTAAELNYLAGVNSNIQTQLTASTQRWRYTDLAADTAVVGEKLFVSAPVGGTIVTLDDAPLVGGEVQIVDGGGNAAPPDNTITVQRTSGSGIRKLENTNTLLSELTFGTNGEMWTFAFLNNTWWAWRNIG